MNKSEQNTGITQEQAPEKQPEAGTAASAEDSTALPFVPYAAEAAMESSGKKQKRMLRILIILIILTAITFAVFFIGKRWNFYEKNMGALHFDYRKGELMDELSDLPHGASAKALAEKIGNSPVSLKAIYYMIDEKGNTSDTVSVYDYTHAADGDRLHSRTGVSGWFVTRSTDSGTTAGNLLPIFDYCFSVDSRTGIRLECIDSYETVLGKTTYTCEVWLLENSTGSQTVYNTLYRYYDGGTLSAVRVLNQYNKIMDIYDIISCTVDG